VTAGTGTEGGELAEPTEGVEPVETDCAEVLLDLSSRIADRPLTYRIPPALGSGVGVGVRALVPLGPRTVHGFVVGVHPCNGAGARRIRDILDVPDPRPLFSGALLELARRVAEENVASLRDAVRCLVPPEILRRPPVLPPPPQFAALDRDKEPHRPGRRQRLILDALAGSPGGVSVADLARLGGRAALHRLVALGAVRVVEATGGGHPLPVQSQRQARLHDGARLADAAPEPPTLLWGDADARRRWIVEAVGEAAKSGMQSLIAVPETALVAGIVAPLRERWGGRVAEFHSDMPEARRRMIWTQIRAGEIDVVVGTRSALFAPLARLGVVIVDEEQDPSYKADGAPRYHGRAVALSRGQIARVQVVLGSPSPSIEAYAAVVEGRMRCVRLPSAGAGVRVVAADMRAERQAGRGGLLARPLVDAIRRHLRAGGRVALFVNRVGYARVLVCRECGRAVHCQRCEIAMPYDGETRTVRCRACGDVTPAPDVCPRCRGVALRWVGPGTARVHEVVRRLFPALRTARLDRETERGFGTIAREFASGRIRLVVGTRLLLRARRLRPNLVGVVDADSPLYLPDFRAAERAFQDLRAVLSLAGGVPDAEAVVQTRVPDHPVIAALRTGRDELWYERELRVRQEFGYPPYAHLARVIASSHDHETARVLAARAAAIARECGVEVLGPAPVLGVGARAQFRVQCLLRSRAAGAVRAAARAVLAGAAPARGSRLVVDVDPQEMR